MHYLFIYLFTLYLFIWFFPEWKAPYHIWENPRLINSYCVLYYICFNMHCISHCNILHVITCGKLPLSWEYTEDVVMDDRMAARCMSSNYSVFASFLSLPTFWSLAVFLYKVYQRSLVARLSPVLPKLYLLYVREQGKALEQGCCQHVTNKSMGEIITV